MRKFVVFFVGLVLMLGLSGCGPGSSGDNDEFETRISMGDSERCGPGEFIVIEGECIPKEAFVAPNVSVGITHNNVHGVESDLELMNDLVADLSGSRGLGIVSEDLFNEQQAAQISTMSLKVLSDTDEEDTQNIIVKLNDEGFFEEVSFTDEHGDLVEVTSNPIALEVFGAFSVVVFEVEGGFDDDTGFSEKIWTAYHAGAMYLIHNESGKVFPLFDVVTEETTIVNTHEYMESREVTVEVGVPVTSRFEDEDGILVEETLYDAEGNEIIFDEGPIQTEFIQVPMEETFRVLTVDDNGDPVLDAEGEPVYEEVTEPILDDEGNPMTYEAEVAVLDEAGEPVRMETFDTTVEVLITEEIVDTYYEVFIERTVLSELGQVFIDRIMQDYYNWNYWRVNDYVINHSSLVYSDDILYYQLEEETEGVMERKVMQVTYDDANKELLVAPFINLTTAQLTECQEVLLDPVGNLLVCVPSDHSKDLTIYSQAEGLMTLEDTEDFSAIVLPNGALYYYTWDFNHVEALGYETQAFYSIAATGTVTPKHIELSEELRVCNSASWCSNQITYDLYDENGDLVMAGLDMYMHYREDETFVEHADLEILSIEDADMTRPACEEEDGCYVRTLYEVYDEDTLFLSVVGGDWYYPEDDIPPVRVVYALESGDTVNYQFLSSNDQQVCDNAEHGCEDVFYIIDGNIGQEDVHNHMSRIVGDGETMINSMTIKDENEAEYVYIRDYAGSICDEASCEAIIPIAFYDDDNMRFNTSSVTMTYAEGETIPLRFDNFADDSTVYEGSTLCDTEGCSQHTEFVLGDSSYYGWLHYENGEQMVSRIVYDETRTETVTEETVERDICLDTGGCEHQEITYTIVDGNGDPVFEQTRTYYPSYGDTVPYQVTFTMDDVDVEYDYEYSQDAKMCTEDNCKTDIALHIGGEWVGWANNVPIANGEQFIHSVDLDNGKTAISESTDSLCLNANGCHQKTDALIIQNSDGERINRDDEQSNQNAFFAFQAPMPVNTDYTITYEMSGRVYETQRIQPYGITNHIGDSMMLGDDMIFIQNTSDSGMGNYILDIDETNTYFKAYTTNLPDLDEIIEFEDGYLGVNANKTAIHYFEPDDTLSDANTMHYTVTNLTEGEPINAIENIETAYDGTIYFDAIDNFIQPIAGTITPEGDIIIDTTYIDREVIRIRPLN